MEKNKPYVRQGLHMRCVELPRRWYGGYGSGIGD